MGLTHFRGHFAPVLHPNEAPAIIIIAKMYEMKLSYLCTAKCTKYSWFVFNLILQRGQVNILIFKKIMK